MRGWGQFPPCRPGRADAADPAPADWRELSRKVRFERAGGQCQRCHPIHDRAYHLAQRRITYRLRYALGDLSLGRYRRGLAVGTMEPG